jgi:outer membrane protein
MKSFFAVVAMLASGLVLSAAAQTPAAAPAAPAPPAKIAVIAFQAAVAQTNEFQRNLADLQKKFEPKRQQLKALSDEIDTLTKQLQTQGNTLSPAEQQSKANSIDTKKKQLDRDAQDAQTDYQQQMQDMFNGVASKVYDVLNAYAEQKGFTVVLDFGGQTTPVLYAAKSTNITQPVIDGYNTKSGVPAPPVEAPAPKPAGPATH